MDFQSIKSAETPEKYLDIAFRRASKKALQNKDKIAREVIRITVVGDYISESLGSLVKSFPSLDDLSEFHKELVQLMLDFDYMKNSLGRINGVSKTVHNLKNKYLRDVKKAEDPIRLRKQFSARTSSMVKKLDKELEYLEKARIKFREFPMVSEDKTFCIAGFPNVGKTTLLSRITNSKPEINSYAFTTKRLNIGFVEKEYKKYQIIDTPGTLSRLEKMNDIEKQAYLALKYLADKVIYVFDLTEPYPLEDQFRLYNNIDNEVICYISKTDLLRENTAKEFIANNKNLEIYTDLNKLVERLIS